MNLYIAAMYTSSFGKGSNGYRKLEPNVKALYDNVRLQLESYHYVHKEGYVRRMRNDGAKVFLDSGAFSAFSLGVHVDIGAYAEYIKENQDIIQMASVLDSIGSHEGTWENQQELERRGCDVLPCFHYGEPLDLCRYYAKNYPYMTVGGMVPVSNGPLERWLDEVWEKCLTDDDGVALTKVHGFGLTSRHLMQKYPWYSVDSSSWVQAAANGSIILPDIDRAIPISDRSPAKKVFGQHYDTFPEPSKRYIADLLAYYGLTVDDVKYDHKPRWALNAFSYDMLGRMLGDDHWQKPFRAKVQTLF